MKKILFALCCMLFSYTAVKSQSLSLNLSANSGCAPVNTTLTFYDPSAASYYIDIYSYYGYYTTSTTSTTLNYTFTNGGYYQIYVAAYDNLGYFISSTNATANISGVASGIYGSAIQGACPGDNVYLQVQTYDFSQSGNVTYDWDLGNGTTYTGIPYDYAYTTYPIAGDYTVTAVANIPSCGTYTVTDTISVSASAGAIPYFSTYLYPNDSVCPGDEVHFGGSNSYTLITDYGDGTYSSGTNITPHQYLSYGLYPVSVTAINGCGNSYTAYDTVYVVPGLANFDPYMYINASDSIVCPNTNIYFYPSNYSYGKRILWDFGNGDTTSLQNPERTWPFSGTRLVTLTTFNGCNSPASVTKNIYVVDTITAGSISLSMTDSICPGSAFMADANIGGYYQGDVEIQYDFGDTIVFGSTDNPAGHIYNTPGNYTVTASYQNGCGYSASSSQSIYVGTAAGTQPGTFFGTPMNEACPGDTLFFLVFPSGGNVTYNIDFGDGSPLANNSNATLLIGPGGLAYDVIKHVYANAGVYNSNATFTSPCGGSYTVNEQADINGSAPPNDAGFFYDDKKFYCLGEEITFFGFGANQLEWDFGDGTGTLLTYGMLNPVPHTYTEPGNYTIKLISTNACGLKDTSTQDINIPDTRINIITNQVAPSCGMSNGKAIAIATGGNTPYTYSWTNGDNSFIADSISSGIYVVTVSDKNGCSNYAIATVSDVQAPTILVNTVIDASCNNGQDGVIDVTIVGSSAPYTYLWSNGHTTEDVNNLVAGPYEITVTDANGCKSNKSITVSEPAEYQISFISSNPDCGLANGALTANVLGTTGPYYFLWANGTNTAINSGIGAGIYDLTVVDAKGCIKEVSATLNNTGAPIIGIDSVSPLDCGVGGADIYITATGTGNTYFWSNGTTNYTTADITNIPAGSYSLTVTSGSGCIATRVIQITDEKPAENPICLVTVDTSTYTNRVIWEEVTQPNLESYNIYRESSQAGLYFLVGNVHKDSLHQYTDPVADPSIRPWRYKIASVSSCGTESFQSAFHKTIHLTINKGLTDSTYNLIWDDYEGQSTYTTFYIWRYKNTTGWQKIDSIAKTDHSYTDYVNGFSSLTDLFYFVEAGPLNGCDPARAVINTSRSNIKQIVQTVDTTSGVGIHEHDQLLNELFIYPNPSKGQITLKAGNDFGRTKIEVTNVLGQVLFSETSVINNKTIDISNFANGVYFVRVYKGDRAMSRKLILSK